jgi:outer membrane protein TolC
MIRQQAQIKPASSSLRRKAAVSLLSVAVLAGCRSPIQRFEAWKCNTDKSYYQEFVTQVEYPDVASCPNPGLESTPLPLSVQNPAELPVWDLTFQEVLTSCLQSSQIFRDLGGTVVQGSAAALTVYDPSVVESNPINGVEAALSAFDAQVSTQLFWQKNNSPNNQFFVGLFPPTREQTTGNYVSSLRKVAANGATFALNTNVIYDRNNSPNQLFPSSFVGWVEAQVRQPLMQGSGVTFNRIAGPGSVVGQYNGVLIGRINTDVSLADFERGVITLINDVETAYWELYYAYRNLDAQVLGRDSSLRTWQRINELQKVGMRGGEADAEAQSRSQYYLFETQVTEALTGANGVYASEQRLRYMMGLPPTDGRLIKPIDKPILAEVEFDWYSAVGDALVHRVEVRRQKWLIKRRELELLASRLNRRARLDAVTSYRWRGLGDHLIGSRDPNNQFESLAQNITEGNFQEWQAGLEWQYNIGLRRASAAQQNAQLNLARENSILRELELRIIHDLSTSSRAMSRSYLQVQNNYNRVAADEQQVEVLRNRYEKGLININFLLQAQQQLSTSTAAYYRTLVDYTLAIRDFHRQKGSLLAYNQVQLAEAGYSPDAYRDAYERGRHFTPRDAGADVRVDPYTFSEGGYQPGNVGRQEVVSPIAEAPPTEVPTVPGPTASPATAAPLPTDPAVPAPTPAVPTE